MKIKNLTGYMLGNEKNVHSVGTPWNKLDSDVWICPTLAMAKKIVLNSQQNPEGLSPIWTTVYRVYGQNIVCTKSASGLLHTNKPSKLVVEKIVYHEVPYELFERMDNDIIDTIKRERTEKKR